jgi:hypothetical protein
MPPVRTVLRADALFDAVMGALLLLSPSRDLFESLGLPDARPEIFTQMLGGLLLCFALLLWEAPGNRHMEHHIGRAACIANALGTLVLVLWLTSGELDIPAKGDVLLWAVTAVLAAFAALEFRHARPS